MKKFGPWTWTLMSGSIKVTRTWFYFVSGGTYNYILLSSYSQWDSFLYSLCFRPIWAITFALRHISVGINVYLCRLYCSNILELVGGTVDRLCDNEQCVAIAWILRRSTKTDWWFWRPSAWYPWSQNRRANYGTKKNQMTAINRRLFDSQESFSSMTCLTAQRTGNRNQEEEPKIKRLMVASNGHFGIGK